MRASHNRLRAHARVDPVAVAFTEDRLRQKGQVHFPDLISAGRVV